MVESRHLSKTQATYDTFGKIIIPFARPDFPDPEMLLPYLNRIHQTRRLSNGGEIHNELERALCDYLSVEHISLFANGTVALMIALKALNLKGSVITSPFTSPATLQAIIWNNLVPVFVDIHTHDLNINPALIKDALTADTSALLPIHVFGKICDLDSIGKMATQHDLRLIYDAAHCFGVSLNGVSVCSFGDFSVLSFHATKVFNTIEGGAIVCKDAYTKRYLDDLKNTGIDQNNNLAGFGFNAKMNELQAAVGLCLLRSVDEAIAKRKYASMVYKELLREIDGIDLFDENEAVRGNYTYLPAMIRENRFGSGRDGLADYLLKNGIITKKYFHPIVSDFSLYREYQTRGLPVAREMAAGILCLPLFKDITESQVTTVVNAIKRFQSLC